MLTLPLPWLGKFGLTPTRTSSRRGRAISQELLAECLEIAKPVIPVIPVIDNAASAREYLLCGKFGLLQTCHQAVIPVIEAVMPVIEEPGAEIPRETGQPDAMTAMTGYDRSDLNLSCPQTRANSQLPADNDRYDRYDRFNEELSCAEAGESEIDPPGNGGYDGWGSLIDKSGCSPYSERFAWWACKVRL